LYSCVSFASQQFFKQILYLKQINVITGGPLGAEGPGQLPPLPPPLIRPCPQQPELMTDQFIQQNRAIILMQQLAVQRKFKFNKTYYPTPVKAKFSLQLRVRFSFKNPTPGPASAKIVDSFRSRLRLRDHL